MKLTKWLTPLSIVSLAIASGSFGLVSCNKNQGDTPEPKGIEQFISDRTFSLRATSYFVDDPQSEYAHAFSCWGTGWIIDDSTVDDTTDFKYFVATNWHVKRGMDKLPTEYEDEQYLGTYFYYADQSLASDPSGILSHNDYQQFDNGCFAYQSVTNFLYVDPDHDEYDCIDMSVAKCNFANAPKSIKDKLIRLNEYRSIHKCINKFVDAGETEIKIKNKYIGGYPVKESGNVKGGRWEYHEIPYSIQNFIYHEVDTQSHAIDGDDPTYRYNDVSPQYFWELPQDPDWMSGGASGSMLITEDLEICGIYWGGQVDKKDDPTWFKPRFSLFLDASCSTDFISRWLSN